MLKIWHALKHQANHRCVKKSLSKRAALSRSLAAHSIGFKPLCLVTEHKDIEPII